MGRITLFLVAALVTCAVAEVSRMAVTECPHHPGQCQDPKTGDFHREGTEWHHPGECKKYACAFPEIIVTGCPVVEVEPPCHLVEGDLTLSYPACCPAGACSRHNHGENTLS